MDQRKRGLKILVLSAGLINLAVVAYIFVAIDRRPPAAGQVGRGMPRDEVISLNGPPHNTVRGAEGRLIEKFKVAGRPDLFVFYDEDTRVSSFFYRHY